MSTPEQTIDNNLYNELVEQSLHPPGEDPSLGAFYQAVVEIINDNHHPLSTLIGETRQLRPQLTVKHFVNLLFRGIQYIKLDNLTENPAYTSYRQPRQWQDELYLIASNPDSRTVLTEVLVNRSTTTTIYQRYAGVHIVTAYIADGSPVLMADLGCGGNYGLRGIELHKPFKPVVDLTPERLASHLLSQDINLERGLAIDQEDPDDPDVRRWRLACSVYPQELSQLSAIAEFEEN